MGRAQRLGDAAGGTRPRVGEPSASLCADEGTRPDPRAGRATGCQCLARLAADEGAGRGVLAAIRRVLAEESGNQTVRLAAWA